MSATSFDSKTFTFKYKTTNINATSFEIDFVVDVPVISFDGGNLAKTELIMVSRKENKMKV